MGEITVNVIKPKSQWTQERSFCICAYVFDDQDNKKSRFERCEENGTAKQFLLMRKPFRSEEDRKRWQKELHVVSQLRHPNIHRYEDAWESRDVRHVLFENARMFLSLHLRERIENGEQGFDRTLFPRWLFQIISALEYIHEQNNENQPMLHRSVNPDNILITDKGILKLCAFETSRRLETRTARATTVLGGTKSVFLSPECQKEGCKYDQSVDIWAFGATAVFIANFKDSGKVGSSFGLLRVLEASGQDSVTQQVIGSALQDKPALRPKASDIVNTLFDQYRTTWGDDPLRSSPCPLLRVESRPAQVSSDPRALSNASNQRQTKRNDNQGSTRNVDATGLSVEQVNSKSGAPRQSEHNNDRAAQASLRNSSYVNNSAQCISSNPDKSRYDGIVAKNLHPTDTRDIPTQTSIYTPRQNHSDKQKTTGTQTSLKKTEVIVLAAHKNMDVKDIVGKIQQQTGQNIVMISKTRTRSSLARARETGSSQPPSASVTSSTTANTTTTTASSSSYRRFPTEGSSDDSLYSARPLYKQLERVHTQLDNSPSTDDSAPHCSSRPHPDSGTTSNSHSRSRSSRYSTRSTASMQDSNYDPHNHDAQDRDSLSGTESFKMNRSAVPISQVSHGNTFEREDPIMGRGVLRKIGQCTSNRQRRTSQATDRQERRSQHTDLDTHRRYSDRNQDARYHSARDQHEICYRAQDDPGRSLGSSGHRRGEESRRRLTDSQAHDRYEDRYSYQYHDHDQEQFQDQDQYQEQYQDQYRVQPAQNERQFYQQQQLRRSQEYRQQPPQPQYHQQRHQRPQRRGSARRGQRYDPQGETDATSGLGDSCLSFDSADE